jgi:hypothetical protein
VRRPPPAANERRLTPPPQKKPHTPNHQQDLVASQLPGDFALRARVLAALATAHRHLQEPPAFERAALERGLDVCRAAVAARSDDWRSGTRPVQEWAVYMRMRLADLDAREGNPAAAAAALEDAVTGGAAAAAAAPAVATTTTTTTRQFPRMTEPRHRIPALLFRVQLAMARGDLDDARTAAEATKALFARLDAPDAMPPEDEREQALQLYAKLHFNVLQILMYVRLGELETLLSYGGAGGGGREGEEEGGNEQEEAGGAAGKAGGGAAAAVSVMVDLLDETEGGVDPPYEWLPREALSALVHLLAVAVYRAGGAPHVRDASRHTDLGLAALAPPLAALGCADAADAARAAAAGRPLPLLVNEQGIDRRDRSRARLLLSLRLLLGEARAQSRLLASDLQGARGEVAAQMLLVERFPGLLGRLLPSVHFQAGLYAQAVGVWPAADAHFAAAIAQGSAAGGRGGGGGGAGGSGGAAAATAAGGGLDRPTAVAAAAYRALCYLAATPGPEAVALGATAMGPLYANAMGGGGGGFGGGGGGFSERPGDLTADVLASAPGLEGNAERAASHVAVALLRLRAGDVPAAKRRLQRALRLAHSRLKSQQLVTQVLHAMAAIVADGAGFGGGDAAAAGIGSEGGGAGAGGAGGAVGGGAASRDYAGAENMLASSSTLCRGIGDVEGQTAALDMLDQLFERMGGGGGGGLSMAASAATTAEQQRKRAQSSNYLAKKRAQMSERLAAAEGGNPAEHRAVLAWGLGF